MRRLFLFVLLFFTVSIYGQTNLIKNNSFQDNSFWVFNYFGDAQGSGSAANGTYQITVEKPGSEKWHLQLMQDGISLENGEYYRFSFEVSSSAPRMLEASVSMNSGDYISYSGRDSYKVTPAFKRVEILFLMDQPTDPSVRVEFNCGLYTGDLSIRNVELIKLSGPLLELQSPSSGDILYHGYPVQIDWQSVGVDSVNIELSIDNGVNWMEISGAIPDTGSCTWVPSGHYSPWCLLRISSCSDGTVSSVSEQFEIAPRTELVRNGTFNDGDSGWDLIDVYGGAASGSVSADGVYAMQAEAAGDEMWYIQLAQTGIALQNGTSYTLSFLAYAETACTIGVNIRKNSTDMRGYFDSSQMVKALSTDPQNFTVDFTMTKESDPDARFEINSGNVGTNIYVDNISLTKRYHTGVKKVSRVVWCQKASITPVVIISPQQFRRQTVHTILPGAGICDLTGRKVRTIINPGQKIVQGLAASGVYMSIPE